MFVVHSMGGLIVKEVITLTQYSAQSSLTTSQGLPPRPERSRVRVDHQSYLRNYIPRYSTSRYQSSDTVEPRPAVHIRQQLEAVYLRSYAEFHCFAKAE